MNTQTIDADIDAEARVRSLIELTESLNEIFAQENTLLESKRPLELEPLQSEKARLAAAYAQSIRDIAENRASVGDADAALLNELRTITGTFEKRAARQRALLDGARAASEGIVKAVAEEAAATASAPGYAGDDKTTAASPAPITIDENA